MPLDAAFGEMCAQDGAKLGLFFRAQTDPIVRAWVGFGDCDGGINALDAEDNVYQGLGEIKDIPDLENVINGKASRVVFQLDGLSAEGLQVADDDDDSFMRKLVTVGLASFDSNWQKNSDIFWLWWGFGDTVMIQTASGESGGAITGTVGLSVGSIFTNRRRPSYSHLSDADQKARSAILNPLGNPDKICERTILYSQGVNKPWPRF